MRKIKGGVVGSAKQFKQDVKKGSGGGYLERVPDEGREGRFLDEPPQWVKYFVHWIDGKSVPCAASDCIGCEQGDRAKKRFAANFFDVNDGKVIPLDVPAQLAKSLDVFYTKYKTLLDRDYELIKEGTGFDTEYSAIPGDPSDMNIKRLSRDKVDLEELIAKQIPDDDGDDDDDDYDDDDDDLDGYDDDDDDEPRNIRRRKPPVASRSASRGSSSNRVASRTRTSSGTRRSTSTKTSGRTARRKKSL